MNTEDIGEFAWERAGVNAPCWIGTSTSTFLVLMFVNKMLANTDQNNLIESCFVSVSDLVLGKLTLAQGASSGAVSSIAFWVVSFGT